VAFPVGSRITLEQMAAGSVSVEADSGVTINAIGGRFVLDGKHSVVNLVKEDSDVWSLEGDLKAPEAAFYWTAQGTAAVAVAGTYVKVSTASSTTAIDEHQFTVSTNNRYTHNGTEKKGFKVLYTLTATCANNIVIIGFKVAINGVVQDGSRIHRKMGTGTDEGAIALLWEMELEPGQYVELWATNFGGTGDVFVEHGTSAIWGS